MAPEQISSQKYSKKVDLYAAGITLYTLLVGFHPLYVTGGTLADNTYSLKQKVATIKPEQWEYPDYMSRLARDFIIKLCHTS